MSVTGSHTVASDSTMAEVLPRIVRGEMGPGAQACLDRRHRGGPWNESHGPRFAGEAGGEGPGPAGGTGSRPPLASGGAGACPLRGTAWVLLEVFPTEPPRSRRGDRCLTRLEPRSSQVNVSRTNADVQSRPDRDIGTRIAARLM